MTADFLLELRCEEIPARMQVKASDDLARLFTDRLAEAGLKAEGLTSYVTPRRLALIARGLPVQTQAVSEEFKGPRTSAPEQALEGFLRKTGLTKDQIEDRDGVWFATVEKPGRATVDVLAEAIPAIIRAFPWPKSMRWGGASVSTESLRWVRPLQGIVAILGEDLVPCQIDGVEAGFSTLGHRFHHPGEITIGSAHDYVEKLRACHVIVDQEERRATIESRAKALAAGAGYALIEDAGLVAENAGLTEWPVPLLGRFDPAFLEVPPEVIQLTLRINQKYFVLRDREGRLAPAFICTANIDAKDGGQAILEGNGKVLAARLSDARFFWQQDRKTKLEDHAKKLERITFHEKLGTVADKVERVAKLARWLVEEGIVQPTSVRPEPVEGRAPTPASRASTSSARTVEELADLAEQAARLAKADLVTEMVGEFPELQGVMGGYYARAEGLPDAVADAIRDHYKPVGQGDDVPTAPVTVAVSLADKLDTLGCFWAADEKPTGSKDPFALRRAAISAESLILQNKLRCGLIVALDRATQTGAMAIKFASDADVAKEMEAAKEKGLSVVAALSMTGLALRSFGQYPGKFDQKAHDLLDFFADRLKVQQKEAGVRHDLIDAVFALGGEDDLVRLLARVHALQSFITTDDGANLLVGYKRAANILKKEGWDSVSAQAGTQNGDAHRDSGLLPSQEHDRNGDGSDDAQSQVGEEDPLASLDDPDVADAMRVHEAAYRLPYDPEPAEADLLAALDSAEPRAAAAVEAEDFEGAMAALASLRAPIDAFFDSVTVNDPEPAKRAARLALLQRVRVAVHKVADFSRIAG